MILWFLPIGLLGKKLLTPIDETSESSNESNQILYLSQRVGKEEILGYAKETNEVISKHD